jgi:spore maturation protein CgeB
MTALMEEVIDEACRVHRPDVLLMGYFFVGPEAVEKLRARYGCLAGYILGFNNILERNVVESMRVSDFLIVHDSYLLPLIKGERYGKKPNVYFILCMADPREHRPVELSAEDVRDYGADVSFIGGAGPNRVEALRRLSRYDLRIWGGAEWARFPELRSCYRSEPVYGLKKTKIYNAARIVLNIEDDDKQINSISNRIPEVLACGGFVISDWRRDLERTPLVEGESVVTYRTLDELEEKVAYYLNTPDERRRVSEHGRRTVLENLTYTHMATPIIEQLDALVRAR